MLEQAYEALPLPVLLVRIDESEPRILMANEAFCREGGYKVSDLKGELLTTAFSTTPSRKKYALQLARQVVITASKGTIPELKEQGSVLDKNEEEDGESAIWATQCTLLKSDTEGPLILVLFSDVGRELQLRQRLTEAERLLETAQQELMSVVDEKRVAREQARKLEDHVEELRSSNTSLEQFAYIASHDLQEPLRKVKSFGDMLQLRYQEKLGPEGSDIIARMQSASLRMSTLIDDLLTYSRSSVKPAEQSIVDTNKVLDGVLLDLERNIQQRGATIFRERLHPVVGHATQLGQVFSNLLCNALKFQRADVPPEIRIQSSVQRGKDTQLALNVADRNKNFQVIRISDNGIGFDNAYRDRIFQIFHRLHSRTDFPGSGVGLAIVKKVVDNHHGYIEAQAEPGKGATFTVLLPMVEA